MSINQKHTRPLPSLILTMMAGITAIADDGATFRAPRSGGDIVSLPSVEAAALCRHTEHSVNHSTGQASIAMPLYTLKCGDMSLPLSLNYVTGGVKVDDEDGPAGVSWELQCGGSVSRRIVGRPDGVNGPVNIPAGSPTLEYLTALDHYTADSDYDRYQYQAGAYSGSFIIKNGAIVLLPESDVKIKQEGDGAFRIVIPDGTEYVYDVQEAVSYRFRPMTYDCKPYSPNYENITCLWRLGRIVNPSKTDSITFEYVDLPSRQRIPSSSVTTLTASDRDIRPISMSYYEDRKGINQHIYTYSNRHGLRRITSRAGTVNFIDANQEPIKGFTVNTPQGKEVRRVTMEYIKYDSKTKRGISLLSAVTVSADGKEIDGATFDYYSTKLYMGNRDMFGFNNYGQGKNYPSESILDVAIPKAPKDSLKPLRPGDVLSTDTTFIPLDSVRIDIPPVVFARVVISDRRLPDLEALQSKSLKSFTSYAGATTEFVYELNRAGQKFHFDTIYHDIAPGLRIKQERTTDHNTGNVLTKEYSYSGGISTIDFSKFGYSSFIGLSGNRGVINDGMTLPSKTYCTTGAVLTTTSLLPGDAMEDAVVYYGNVRETVTGTGLNRPVVTDYIFDTANAASPYIIAGKPALTDSQMHDKRYCGTNIMIYANTALVHAYGAILSPKLISGYFRQTFRDKAPLIKKTEWVTDSCGTLSRPLRVTDYIYSYDDEKIYTTGYYSTPLVRLYDNPISELSGEDYKSTDDFNYFPVTVATCKSWCDSVRTTEYDGYGNSRTVTTAFEYNDHISNPAGTGSFIDRDSILDNLHGGTILPYVSGRYSLISSVSKSCGGDVYSTDYLYSCNSRSDLLIKAKSQGRISLPVSVNYRHGTFRLEKRYNYADFGAAQGNLQLSSMVCVAGGTVLTDSVSIMRYDRYGNPTEGYDFSGRTSRYTWGDVGTYLQQVSKAGNLDTKYEYSPLVGYTRMVTPAGTSTYYGYSAGRLCSVTTAGDITATYRYFQYGTDRINKIEVAHTGANGQTATGISRYDAFGNKILDGVSGGIGGASLLSVTQYDILGRKVMEYMPVDCSNPDGDIETIAQSAATAYDGDNEAMRRFGYMAALDNRVRTVTIGGEEFAGHPARSDYRFNTDADGDGMYRCRRYRVNGNTLVYDGYYEKGTLEIAESIDGDGRRTLTFTDFAGNAVLSRTVTDSGTADTYTIYNDAGDVALVLQPLASSALNAEGTSYDISSNETLLRYADYYRYDNRLLLTERRMAGTEPAIYRYDAAGRLIFTQDGEQRARGVAGFTIYDLSGRTALEGEALATTQLLEGVSSWKPYAMRSQTLSGRHAGYGVSMAMSCVVVDKAYYYDDYSFLSEACCAALDSVLAAKPLTVKRSNNRGLLTGTLSRINAACDFDGSAPSVAGARYVATALGYDSRERVGESVSVDHQRVAVSETSTYSMSGLPLTVATVRRDPDGGVEKIASTYTYDDFERQTSVVTSINDADIARSVTNYDGVGRVASVSVKDLRSDLAETVRYSYITNGAVKSVTTASGSLSIALKYASGAAPSYSGNISGMDWTGADKANRSYIYRYDPLNRLMSANYSESGRPSYPYLRYLMPPDYTCAYTYDLNSNPLSIKRKGLTSISGSADTGISPAFGTVDDLTLRYSGNRLTKVDDSGSSTYYTGAPDFYDTRYFNIEYEYDANGNLTADLNRGITGVVYNSLNLPVRVEMRDGSLIENLYDADGSLRQRSLRQKATGTPSVGGAFPSDSIDTEGYYVHVTDFCGPWEYVNGKLSRTRIPGGYIIGDSVYFNITDHQGNIRQVWNATTGQTVQDNHYYPYGAPFGESASTEFVKAMARARQSEVSTNQYKYSAKEWMPAFGLNLYDFSARQYDPILCRFTSPDPLNFNYPHLSPYLYCAANPINYSDPSGLAAIYNSSGMHVGNTKEGFTGQIYIYDGSEEIDFSKYYEYQLSSLNIYIRKYDDVANLLSSNAQTAIWNNIIFHFEGMNIFGEIFRMNRIEGGGIKYRHGNDETITWGTVFNLACGIQLLRPRIYGTGNFIKVYEATVENIVLSVLVHEWYSHGIMNYCDMDNTHRFAYQNIIRYEPFWNMTTDKYKRAVLFEFIRYTFSETGSISLFISFFNYFKKICTIELNT